MQLAYGGDAYGGDAYGGDAAGGGDAACGELNIKHRVLTAIKSKVQTTHMMRCNKLS